MHAASAGTKSSPAGTMSKAFMTAKRAATACTVLYYTPFTVFNRSGVIFLYKMD
jgi:hypothetical protein